MIYEKIFYFKCGINFRFGSWEKIVDEVVIEWKQKLEKEYFDEIYPNKDKEIFYKYYKSI